MRIRETRTQHSLPTSKPMLHILKHGNSSTKIFPLNLFGSKKRGSGNQEYEQGFAIGRMYYAHPSSGERFYLRTLLAAVKGAKYQNSRGLELQSRYRGHVILCVAPSYGNQGVLVFQRVGKRVCPEWGTGGRRT